MPSVYEGFDLVDILYDEENYYKYNLDYELHDLLYVPHDNPRHRMSIGEHMFECEKQMKMKLVGLKELSDIRKESLILSSLYHDIGKSIVKSFRNSKGEPVEHATYYQHHCVGAYDLLFYLFQSKTNKELLIRTILLVNQHMKPFDWKNNQNSDKSIMKFINIYGEDLYEDVMLLHQCDLLAH